MNRKHVDAVVFVALILCAAVSRLLPHLPNFTPLAAVALFAGFWFANRGVAMLVPLGALVVSDLVLGGYEIGVMSTVYAALVLPVAMRGILRSRLSPLRVGGAAIISSIVFYLTTNLAHWLWMHTYPLTWTGLVECYVAALPFLKYQLAGDMLWSGGLFGAYAMGTSLLRTQTKALSAG